MSYMSDNSESIISLLKKKLDLKGLDKEYRVLEIGRSEIIEVEYDSWGRGQYYNNLYIEIPIEFFIEIEVEISKIEELLKKELESLNRGDTGEHISSITINASKETSPAGIPLSKINKTNGDSLWEKGNFRLFLSHVSTSKKLAHELKEDLLKYGVSAFVAHDDIEPTSEWQLKIEEALQSMEALTAIITKDFQSSFWCDQETGIAIGLKKLVVPVRMGADPHGFLGKYQGLSGFDKEAIQISKEIFTALTGHESTRIKMALAVIQLFVHSDSYSNAIFNMSLLEQLPVITPDMAEQLKKSVNENSQINGAFGISERVSQLLNNKGYKTR